MALTAKFYSFEKRRNSTKQPSGASTDFNVVLKGGSSLITPTLILHTNSMANFNYLQFEGRYYYITDIISTRNELWEIHCTVDVLATYKTQIGNTPAMIMYATGGSNDIIDQRLGVKSPIDVRSKAAILTGDFTGFTDSSEGIAIVSITGVGSFGNYLLQSSTDVSKLLRDAENWTNVNLTTVEQCLRQLFMAGNAPECLRNAIYLPIILSTLSNFDAPTQLNLGAYPCTDENGNPINGLRVNNPFLSASCTIDIPWKYNDWRRNAPYTKVFLYLPVFGLISITSTDIINEEKLSVLYSLNMLGGDMAFQVRGATSSRKLATGSANIAMQSPYGSANIASSKALAGVGVGVGALAGIAAGAITGGTATLAAFGGIGAASSGLVAALGGQTGGGGGLTGSAVTGLDLGVMCTTLTHDLTDSQTSVNPIMGKPVMAKHTINTYSGFVQTDGMKVIGAMTEIEHTQINSACDNGIYFE